jgi:hypothetical protein
MAEKIAALLTGMTPADLEALPPLRRREFADLCRHWALLAEGTAHLPRPSGVLYELQSGQRSE